MNMNGKRERRIFEIMLVIVTVGMTYLVYRMGGYKLVALNLFFLPIVLSGYYLGRTSAGILALFCALAVTVATTLDPSGFAAYSSPITIGLALTVWAAVLGMTAILVGTLCDERAAKVNELHEAYVGVVEVLSRYLQTGDPKVKGKPIRVAEMCQSVAEEMKLPRKQIDDIRVGALLSDLGNVEITTKLMSRAVDSLESGSSGSEHHTFLGTDLLDSLGMVLHSALPLLMSQPESCAPQKGFHDAPASAEDGLCGDVPLGARIIHAVRAYDDLVSADADGQTNSSTGAIAELRRAASKEVEREVVTAIERTVKRASTARATEHAFV